MESPELSDTLWRSRVIYYHQTSKISWFTLSDYKSTKTQTLCSNLLSLGLVVRTSKWSFWGGGVPGRMLTSTSSRTIFPCTLRTGPKFGPYKDREVNGKGRVPELHREDNTMKKDTEVNVLKKRVGKKKKKITLYSEGE